MFMDTVCGSVNREGFKFRRPGFILVSINCDNGQITEQLSFDTHRVLVSLNSRSDFRLHYLMIREPFLSLLPK